MNEGVSHKSCVVRQSHYENIHEHLEKRSRSFVINPRVEWVSFSHSETSPDVSRCLRPEVMERLK